MRKLLFGAAAAITSYITVKSVQNRSHAEPNVTGVSAGDEETYEPKPMFYVGDEVLIYSPYTAEFFTQDWQVDPEMYEITAVKYDDEQEVFRYQLKNGLSNDWYSEDWLSLPKETHFIREWVPNKPTPDEPTPEMAEVERNILGKALDDSAKQTQIDSLLDRLGWAINYGTGEEQQEYKRRLREITGREMK